jgi:hypothetical protein
MVSQAFLLCGTHSTNKTLSTLRPWVSLLNDPPNDIQAHWDRFGYLPAPWYAALPTPPNIRRPQASNDLDTVGTETRCLGFGHPAGSSISTNDPALA